MPRSGPRITREELAERIRKKVLSMRPAEPIQLTRAGLAHQLSGELISEANPPADWLMAHNSNEFWRPDEVIDISALLWEYVQAGILQPHSSYSSNQDQGVWAHVYTTEEGLSRLAGQNPIPEFASEYLARLRIIAPRLDETETFYVEEGLRAFRARLFPSAVVMVGCAAEHLVERLALVARPLVPEKARLKYDQDLEGNISRVWRACWTYIEPQLKKLVPGKIVGTQLGLTALFLVIKAARDDAGHPQAARPSVEEGRTILSTFPESARAASDLLSALDLSL